MGRVVMMMVVILALMVTGCGDLMGPPRGKVKAWVETPPPTECVWGGWLEVIFRARQRPPDTTYWRLDHYDAGYVINAGAAMPGEEVSHKVCVHERLTAMLLFVAWGPRTKADTAIWVQEGM